MRQPLKGPLSTWHLEQTLRDVRVDGIQVGLHNLALLAGVRAPYRVGLLRAGEA